MSGAALGWAKAQHAPSMIAKAVLVCLADYADAAGVAWPSVPALAQEVQVSDRTVQRCLKALSEAGLLTVERRTRKDGGWTSNGYRLAMFAAEEGRPPSDTVSPAPRQAVTSLVTLLSPATEPQSNHSLSDESETRAPDPFDQFWSAYPAKVGKKAALNAWRKARDKPTLPEMLAAVDRYRRNKPPDRDWCHPTTWLNQGRWADQAEEPPDAASPAALASTPEAEARRARHESLLSRMSDAPTC